MASSSTGPSESGRRRGQRGPDDVVSTSKKKQKDRANQESKEAKRATSATSSVTRKDLFVDWKQNVYEVIVRLNCEDAGVLRVEDIDYAFSDSACHIRLPDGREWSCHLHEEIEASCSKLLYKEKIKVLQLVMHKKIPLNTWPTFANKKKTEKVNILRENGSNHHQSTTGQSEKSGEIIEKMPTVTTAEQKRGKPDRGLKRGMKGKQVELTESTGVKVAEIKSNDKADPINEPSTKRTTRPSRNTKEPQLAPCSTKESQSKQAVNGKTHSLAVSSGASSASNSKDNRVQMQVKGQGCQASPREKEMDRRPKSNDQVEENESKTVSSVCELKVAQQESSPLVKMHTGNIAADERENRKDEKKPQVDAQIPKMLPSPDLVSGAPVSTASKREESPQKSCTEEKKDKSKEDPHGGSQEEDTEGPEPMVNLKFVKNDSYEKGIDLMVVNVYMKEICRQTSRVLFREQDFTLVFQSSDPNFLRLHPDCGPNTVFKWQVKLRNLIQPDQSSYAFTPSRIDITLKKRHSQRWGGLEAPATQEVLQVRDNSDVSITFDPFLYLPVPLPQKQKVLTVFYFAKEPHKKPVKFLVSVSKENSSTAEVLESISRSVRIKPENLWLAEVVKNRFHRIFSPSQSLDTVSSSDLLFCFEVLSKDLAKERVVLLKVQQRPLVPSIPITKCAGCMKPPASDDEKLKRCTRCYRVGYCNQACQKKHWPNHKTTCRPNVENIGLPFLISVPESRLTYSRLTQLLEGYSRYSVNVFQPPFQSGRTSPEASLSHVDLASLASNVSECQEQEEEQSSAGEAENQAEQGDSVTAPQTETVSVISAAGGDTLSAHTNDSGCGELATSSQNSLVEKETSCEKAIKPEAVVTGYQQPSESATGSASQFHITVLDSSQKEDRKLEDKGDVILELPDDCTLELVWKNNERQKEYVLVRSKELEFDEDPGSATETSRAGHFTLEQCLNLFTKPEVLAPEEAWYCPKCQQHREASKQLLLWRLPNVLIIQLKRFSFRSFIWRDKINDMVDFPVRNLDLSKFCIGHKGDIQQPPIYDLYAVINHYGGMIGGHYTAYARLPSDKNSQRSDVGWRLFDDSTVTTVEESQVVTRYAYVLFYRRRNSPVERPSHLLGPLGAESSAATGGAASQASLIWQELEEDEEGQQEASFRSLFCPGLRGRRARMRPEEEEEGRGGHSHRRRDRISDYSDGERLRYFIMGTVAAVLALLFNLIYPLLYWSNWA
ncbi:ubiquitin carboxyl-terminal hydrolase 19-like [Sinocyclocheilus grahami]|uniref:ubiquitin carboxyl-terminal hydrolase 19-like n=1 Tax=Sinocyclocheilus grahami TaxID=75366 RepID=UPI0007AC82AF|nr:PREDICTED: ubiquitin carboxyl-terminal hydrolase 19-like [Sinocyclocheilus grahami]